MNLNQLGLHEGLLHALEARGLDSLYPFLEKTIHHVIGKKESVSAQVRMGSGRENLYLVPLLQWLLTEGAEGRALVILPSDQDVSVAKNHAQDLAEAVGIPVHALGHEPDAADASAPLSMGAADVIAARQEAETLDLKGYAFVVVDGLEKFAEPLHGASLRRLRSHLRPSWERRTIVFAEKLGIKEQTLALDLADAPTELYLEEETEKAKHVPQATWYISSDSKMKLLLGVLAANPRKPAAVFCNLRENAVEVGRRLAANGKRVETIEKLLSQAQKDSLLARARSGELEAVAFTDESARGFGRGSFPLVVNYDIPLEGEPYLERILFLDPAAEGGRVVNFACDRYVYGIPAVEQFMGISLGAVQADEGMLAPVDKSAGMSFGRGGNTNDRGGSRGASARRYGQGEARPGSRGGRHDRNAKQPGRPPRGNEREYRRDDRARGREGDARNQESIRAGIAELTGVNLGGSGARNRVQGETQHKERSPSGRGPRGDGPGQGGKRNKHGRRGPPSSSRFRGKEPSATASFEDPYALPMEERMRLYKEKYGKHLAEEKLPKAPGRKKGRRRKGGASGAQAASDGQREQQRGAGSAAPSAPAPVREPPVTGGIEESRSSIIGRLIGAIRKDKEE